MPKVALADTLADWDRIIEAARRRVAEHPQIRPILEELEGIRDLSKALEQERVSLQARRQEATQKLRQSKDEGKELARRLREVLKALLGSRNEALVEFNIRPRRPYGPRKNDARRHRKGDGSHASGGGAKKKGTSR